MPSSDAMIAKSSHSWTAALRTIAISIMIAIDDVNCLNKIWYQRTTFSGIAFDPYFSVAAAAASDVRPTMSASAWACVAHSIST